MVCGALFWAPHASAHANLRASSPSSGATLNHDPAEVILRFTEQPELALSEVRVLASDGIRFDQGKPRTVPGDDRALRVPVELPEGVFTVAWRTVSKVDGHATAGSFAFGLGVPAADVKPSSVSDAKTTLPSPLEVFGRWLLIAGLVVAFGAALLGAVALTDPTGAVRTLVRTAALVALGGVAFLGAAQGFDAGVALSVLLPTAVGRALVLRTVAVVATLAAAFAAGARGRIRRVALAAAALAAAAAMLAEVSAGHAAAATSLPWVQVLAQWVHFAAVGAWIGGLAALLIAIRGETSATKAHAVRRFSAMAGIAIFAVAGMGTFRAVYQIGSWSGLWSSGYGRVVLIKGALFLVLATLGAVNRYRNVPEAERALAGLRRVSRAEISIAVVVLLATAVLTGLSPHPPSAQADDAGSVAVAGEDPGQTFHVELQIEPALAGPNTFRARVIDRDTGDPIERGTVSLRFELIGDEPIGSSTLQLRRRDDAWIGDGANMALDGRYEITVLVQLETTSAEIPLEVATRCRTKVMSAGGPGQPTIYTQQLSAGSVQTYVDPGTAGTNEIHFTFFNTKGNELNVPKTPSIDAWRPGRDVIALNVRRFSAGHFIARGRLTTGLWRFDTTVKAKGSSQPLRACFEETIR